MLLTSTDETAAERLGRRETGSGLAEHVHRSAVAARRLERADASVVRIATDGRTVIEIASEVLTAAGWLAADDGNATSP